MLALAAILIPNSQLTEETAQEIQRIFWIDLLPTCDFNDVSSMPVVVHAFYVIATLAFPVLIGLMVWYGALGTRFGIALADPSWGGFKHLLSIYLLVFPGFGLITWVVWYTSGNVVSPTSQSFGQVALRAMLNDRVALAVLGPMLVTGLASLLFGLLTYLLGPILYLVSPKERGQK